MKGLTVIFTHEEAQPVYDRHAPFWIAHGFPVLTFCPLNDNVSAIGELVKNGRGDKWGKSHILKLRIALENIALREDADWIICYEYDALCLTPEIPQHIFEKRGFWSTEFPNGDTRWFAPFYCHFPWIVDRATLRSMVLYAKDHRTPMEEGFSDRWIAGVLHRYKVKHYPFEKLSYSQNTIEDMHLEDAKQKVRDGAILIHGIKTAKTLGELMKARTECKV